MDAYENLVRRIAHRHRVRRQIELMQDALTLIRDEAGAPLEYAGGMPTGIKDASWCAGVAMSALAAIEEDE